MILPLALSKILVAAALQGSAPLALPDVVREARLHSAEVRMARDEYQAAKARVGQQASRQRPQIGFVGSATRFDDKSEVSFGGQTMEVLPDHTETLSLQLDQILDFSGQVGASVSQARLFALASEFALASTTADADLVATTAYYDLLRSDQSVRVAQSAVDAYREQLKVNTKLYEGGVGQKIDVLRAQSQVADAERELVRRQNDRNAAKSRLNDLLGRPLDAETKLAESDATAKDAAESLDRAHLIEAAQNRRTEALTAETEVRAAEKGIKLARSSSEPRFSVGLAGNYYPTTSFQYVRQSTVALTFGVSIPISDGGLAKDRVREARSLVDIAKAREDRVRRDIALQVQTAALDVETARKRLDAATIAFNAATAARALAQQRYEAQVGLYLEITDAQAALTQAEAARVDAAYDLLTAQARLTRAMGEPLVK